MTFRFVLLFAAIASFQATAMLSAQAQALGPSTAPLWMRYSAISPDGKAIAFTFQGHIFTVPSSGGRAEALTGGPAHDSAPVWSPDGRLIAFASDRYGHYDVYLMSAQGGPARRLTTCSTDQVPTAFTPDGRFVLFSANRMGSATSSEFPAGRWTPQLFRVSIDGGREPELVLTSPALNARYDRAGQRILYEDLKGYEDLWRKHETYSVAPDIWIYDSKTGDHTKLTNVRGENRNPVWAPDENSVYYLSEQSGSFNVWKLPLGGNKPGTPEQITQFDKNPVRFLSSSVTGDLCFGFDGELYTLPAGAHDPQKVAVQISLTDNAPRIRTEQFADQVTEIALSPNGKEIAFVVRGDIFVASSEDGMTKRITNTPGQERSVAFSPDGRHLVFAAEYNKPWALYEGSIVQPKAKEPYFFDSTVIDIHPVLDNGHENFQPKYSPDGKEIAYLEDRTTLKVLNLESRQTRVILPGDRNYSYEDGDQWFDWSPDGKWFLVSFLDLNRWSKEAGLVDSAGNQELTNLTKSGYEDEKPEWTMDGKSMIWLTDRYGLHGDGYAENAQVDVYEMFFTQAAFDRFKLSKAEYGILKAKEDEEQRKKEKEESREQTTGAGETEQTKIEPIPIDLKNIEDRTARLTLGSTPIADAKLTKDGEILVYLAKSDKGFELFSLKIREKELKRLAEFEAPEHHGPGIKFPQQVELTSDGKNAYVLVNGKINKVTIADGKSEPVKFSAEKEIDSAAERACLFEHMWRQMKEKFYLQDMNGVDWDYYKRVYARFLPFIVDNRDFAEMMSEMLGELNASHTGCRYYPQNMDQTAALGAFFDPTFTGPGVKIQEVIDKGPLVTASAPIQAGMVIEKIDATTIAPGMDLSPLLNHKAGKPTLLTILDPAKNSRFEVTVKPTGLAEQEGLLYERWVKQRREIVNRLSNGTIGYVHVRSMTDESYRDTFAEALGQESGKKALIVDTRFNGGGNLHDQLETFLNGKTYLLAIPRGQSLGWEPFNKWNKPSAVLVGESNYSDADLFPWIYQHFAIGKLVGMPVPGTGTSVWWETQQDPTLLFGIPEVGRLDAQGHYLENIQVEPDIKVENDPRSRAEGRDLQLEAAVRELIK